jgi:hypothetical protein
LQARGFCVGEAELTAHFGEASNSCSWEAISERKGPSCPSDSQHQFRFEQVLQGANMCSDKRHPAVAVR